MASEPHSTLNEFFIHESPLPSTAYAIRNQTPPPPAQSTNPFRHSNLRRLPSRPPSATLMHISTTPPQLHHLISLIPKTINTRDRPLDPVVTLSKNRQPCHHLPSTYPLPCISIRLPPSMPAAPLPPPSPAYIFRGHNAPIHSAIFIWNNTRLVTADAEGWVVLWSLKTRRATAVWRAHDGVVLGVGTWGEESIIT